MIYKNIKPLKQKQNQAVRLPDTPEGEVLRALAGMCCSVCDLPLPTVNRKSPWGHDIHDSTYTCCGTAYCPYCGRNGKEKCEHLVACRTSGKWQIFGLPDIDSLPYSQLTLLYSALLDHTIAQRQEAFGDAYSLLSTLFSPWQGSSVARCLNGFVLTEHLVRPESTHYVEKNNNVFYFSSTTDGIAARLQQALYHSVPEGLKKLDEKLLSDHPYVSGGLELPYIPSSIFQHDKQLASLSSIADYMTAFNSWRIRERRSIGFSPCGKYLIAMNAICVQIWNMLEPSPQHICTINAPIDPITGKQSYYKDFRIDSSANSICLSCDYLSSFHEEGAANWDTHSLIDGTLLDREARKEYAPMTTNTKTAGTPRNYDAVLHHGKSCLVIKNRSMLLYCLAPTKRRGRKKLCIPVKSKIERIAVSPDGQTFATLTDRLVCIWRIPHRGNYRNDHVL